MIESKEFTCPECGSHYYGTSSVGLLTEYPSAEALGDAFDKLSIGQCHGYFPSKGPLGPKPCRFTWKRSEDAKYFRGTGTFHPNGVGAIARR